MCGRGSRAAQLSRPYRQCRHVTSLEMKRARSLPIGPLFCGVIFGVSD
jgi:hypothetical protein